MKKEYQNSGLRNSMSVMLLTGILISGAACTTSVEGEGAAGGKLTDAQIVNHLESKVAASVWRHFEETVGDDATALSAAVQQEPLRILVFHRFGEPVTLNNISLGQATSTDLAQLAVDVASQQDEVVKRVTELNAQKDTRQPPLRILDRPQYNYFVVMEVASRADVEWLAERSWVAEVRRDKLNELFTVEGRQLVGSDVVEQSGYDGDGVGIAIVDTHFGLLHPELGGSTSLPNGVVFGGYNYSDPGDPIHSQNFDDCYHGTGTLSIAKRYATGADMYGLTVFPNAYDSVIVNAINWCINNRNGVNGGAPIRIISMSLGGGSYTNYCTSDTIGQAAGNALAYGIVTFAATGNDGYANMIASPACSPNVIAVGSVWDENGANYSPFPPAYCSDSNRLVNERTCYSNMSAIMDVYAPSEEVICAQCGGGTWALGGTSSACPAAAGMTAQLFDAVPGLIGDKNGILQLYQSTGVTVIEDSDEVRIDLAAAVAAVGCVSHDSFACYNGDVYWYDSCGVREELKQSCGGAGCLNGVCQGSSGGADYDSTDTPIAIPDNNATGITSTIAVTETQTVQAVAVDVDITHTYIGDLIVTLVCPNGATQTLHDLAGGSADDIHQTYTVTACNGHPADGNWRIEVSDHASVDVGTLDSWSLHLDFNASDGNIDQPSLDTPITIPDNNATGITSTIPVSASGVVTDLSVDVDITHTYIGDLIVSLVCPSGTTTVLHNRSGGSADNIHTTYSISGCDGQSVSGNWQLEVSDRASLDVGTLDEWTLHVTYQ